MPLTACQICDPLSDPDWDRKVAAQPGSTVFHSAAWARVLQETYGFAPAYFAQGYGDRLRSLLPVFEVDSWLTGRRGVSLPFTDDCPPLTESPDAYAELLAAAKAHGRTRRWRYLELRGGREHLQEAPTHAWFFDHSLDLRRHEPAVMEGFGSSVRRAIRKAEKSDLNVEFSRSPEAMRAFYDLMCISRKRQGAPPQPFRFFQSIWRHLLAENKGWIVLARQGATAVAGAVYFHWGKSALYKFGASDERHQELRPNNLVMYRAIQWHRENGFEVLGFGRTAPYAEGLRRFKLGWGTAERRVEYLKYGFHSARFEASSNESEPRSTPLFKRLPRPVLRSVGALLYRHVG